MSQPFQYRSRSDDAWKRRGEQSGSQFQSFILESFNMYGMKKGENWVRFCPPTWENPSHYGLDIWVHYSVGPNNDSVLCNLKMKKGPCSICEAKDKAESEGKDELADDYKPTRRVLVWLLDRKEEKEVLACAMPWTLDRDISALCRDRTTGELYQIDHPEQGFDVSFDRTGEVPQIKYIGVQIARRPSPVKQEFIDFVVKNPLPSILWYRTYAEVLEIFTGGAAEQPATQASVVTNPPQPTAQVVEPPRTAAPEPVAPPPPPVVAAPMPPPPPKPFQSEWTGKNCPVCQQPTYTISATEQTCQGGHVSAIFAAPPPPQPPPPPTPSNDNGAATPPPAASSRAESLKSRFTTGKA